MVISMGGFLKSRSKSWMSTMFVLLLLALPVCGQGLIQLKLRIPAPGAGSKGLEAVMIRPDEPGPHPLALVNHGAPREKADQRKMTPWEMLPEAREFARRGWTAVIVMRRGYGDSGGDFAEDSRGCGSNPDYYGAGLQSASDLRAAIAYLSKLPEVDPSRIISIGRSAGGFATVALTAKPPPGLIAGINFAGGRGSPVEDQVCNPADLINAFRAFGKTSRIPMLWVYAQNDHFFSPEIAAEFYRAFSAGGGRAQFVGAGPFGADGHGLFSLDGITVWAPMVDAFLRNQNLSLRKTLLALPEPPGIDPPSQLSRTGRAEFRQFLTLPMHRAFAVSANGHFGYSFGARTDKDAERSAEERCVNYAGKNEGCTLYVVDDARRP
jgi:dienelactone hydrolase